MFLIDLMFNFLIFNRFITWRRSSRWG